MPRQIIHTQQAPAAIGPYSQAVEVNGVLYVSGQIPIDPATGRIETTDIREQTEQVMKNLQNILKAALYTFSDVCKCTIFVKDLADFGVVNEVYGSYLTVGQEPARECVEVAKLPKDALVEISCIAVR